MNHIQCCIFIMFSGILFPSINLAGGWRAVPANQAMYALRRSAGWGNATTKLLDVDLPRNQLSYTYKFGWCRADVTSPQFIRKTYNLTLPTLQHQLADYLYFLDDKHTRRYSSQCVVMKGYVNRKYLFYKSRLPLYYCQGTVFILMLRTVKRYAIHEFYLYDKLNMPISFVFEFYQAPEL